MTVTPQSGTSKPGEVVPAEDLVTLTIDGIETSVPKGTLVIRAAEQIGVQIPRFCDHPLLAPVGACRQCLVEVALPGPDGEPRTMMGPPGRVKPQASCTLVASEGMVVNTQLTSPIADKAQHGVMDVQRDQPALDRTELLAKAHHPVREEGERQGVRHGELDQVLTGRPVGAHQVARGLQGTDDLQSLPQEGLPGRRQSRGV